MLSERKRRVAVASVLVLIFVVSTLLAGSARASSSGIKVGPNVDIRGEAAPDRSVHDPSIAVDPRNPAIIVAAAEDRSLIPPGGCFSADRCHTWVSYFRSTDSGSSWSSRLVPGFLGDTSAAGLSSPLRNFAHIGFASVVFDRSGNVYLSVYAINMDSSGTPIGDSSRVAVIKFANDGADYVRATALLILDGDFPRIAVDTSGGPNAGNLYILFTQFLKDFGYNGFFTRSTDGGVSFSAPIPTPGAGLAAGLAVNPNGNVFVEKVRCTGVSLSCSTDSSATILVDKSVDGGLTFGPPVVAATAVLRPIPFPGNGFLAGVFPAMSMHMLADSSGVDIVWDDFGTGTANVLFSRSTDGGASWSGPVRVNDVTHGEHFLSAIADSGGVISVVWYDSRLGQLPNGTITKLDVFYAESRDGGASFSASVRVTSASFDPNLVLTTDFGPGFAFTPFLGDRIDIAASPGVAHALWTDNRNACDTVDPTFGCVDQDVLTATITP